jgi:EAL domain-containing protein (putative c-di-GMP-specific phosphodiesterase class I)
LHSDASLRRLISLAARALDMAGASVLPIGSANHGPITSPGYDQAQGHLVAGLDAAVAGSRRPLAVPDFADQSSQTSPARGLLTGAYLGVPIVSSRDTVTGVLHVLDPKPRPVLDRHAGLLSAFGRAISDHLELTPDTDATDLDAALVADVAQAIFSGNIAPWYQPIVDLSTGEIVGLEALARRRYPGGRIESPAAFVPIAERSDLIVDLDVAVARIALNDLRRLQVKNPALRMSVNISGRHLDQDGWVANLADLATASGVSPSTVNLEITETARPTSSVFAADQIRLARSLGFSLWLDDFGCGWSGLRDLLDLSVDGIKLDQSFGEVLGTKAGNVIIGALTLAATDLGLKVTVEGIERAEQARLARELGCDYGQGFFWSKPVSAAGIDLLLDQLWTTKGPAMRGSERWGEVRSC